MPQSVLSRDRLRALLPVPLSDEQLGELLFSSKAELVASEGDLLTVSVTPDRLDLLSEAGLALHLEGALDAVTGLPRIAEEPRRDPAPEIRAESSVRPVRPAIAGVLVRSPTDEGIDEGTLAEAIRFQEILHATVGRDRRTASLGIYPWDRLTSPIRYAMEPLGEVRFVPLDGTEEIPADRFLAEHPLAAKYGAYGRVGDRCLVLRDAAGSVLSLPPILNSRTVGEARVGDRELLLESTGRELRVVRDSLGLLLVVFASRGWTVLPVSVRGPGRFRDSGTSLFRPHPVPLASTTLRAMLGESMASAEVERRLGQARLGVRSRRGGWTVEAPPWRPDLLTTVDAVEDVLQAVPMRAEQGLLPPSRTIGRRRPESTFRRRFAVELLGLGFAAPLTPVLVSEAGVARVRGADPIRLANPVSAEFAFVRDRLFLSHLEVLGRNTRHGYPQRFAEVAPVVVRAPSSEGGGETRYHAGLMLAAETAGFADAAAIVDYLLRGRDVAGVREPIVLPGAIPGRAARLRLAGEVVAELGEVDPEILTSLGVPVPAAWAEVDLSALWPLLAGREAP